MKKIQLICGIITSIAGICGIIDFYFNYIKTGKMELNYHYLLYGFVILGIVVLIILWIYGKIQDSFDHTNNLIKAQQIVNNKILEKIKELQDIVGVKRSKSLFTDSEWAIIKTLLDEDKLKK